VGFLTTKIMREGDSDENEVVAPDRWFDGSLNFPIGFVDHLPHGRCPTTSRGRESDRKALHKRRKKGADVANEQSMLMEDKRVRREWRLSEEIKSLGRDLTNTVDLRSIAGGRSPALSITKNLKVLDPELGKSGRADHRLRLCKFSLLGMHDPCHLIPRRVMNRGVHIANDEEREALNRASVGLISGRGLLLRRRRERRGRACRMSSPPAGVPLHSFM